MKSDIDLMNLYKEEKALVIGSLAERTGLEDFPSYKEWKLEYMKEYAETHDMKNPVSMEEAVRLLEAELDDEDDDLLPDEDLALLANTHEPPDEEDNMTEEATTNTKPEPATTNTPTKPKRAAKKVAAKKVAAKKRPPSKASAAQKVFDRLYPKVLTGKKARKDVITELTENVGLTANGAATYYQKMLTAAKKAATEK